MATLFYSTVTAMTLLLRVVDKKRAVLTTSRLFVRLKSSGSDGNNMKKNMEIQIEQGGLVKIPKELRERYNIKTGDLLTFLDIGGAIVLIPQRSQIDKLADKIKDDLIKGGETLKGMLLTMREVREASSIENQEKGL